MDDFFQRGDAPLDEEQMKHLLIGAFQVRDADAQIYAANLLKQRIVSVNDLKLADRDTFRACGLALGDANRILKKFAERDVDTFLTISKLPLVYSTTTEGNNATNVTVSVESTQPVKVVHWRSFDREAMTFRVETDLKVPKLDVPTQYELGIESELDTLVKLHVHVFIPCGRVLSKIHRPSSFNFPCPPTNNRNNNVNADTNIMIMDPNQGISRVLCPVEVKPFTKFGQATSRRNEITTVEQLIQEYEQQLRNVCSTSDVYWGLTQLLGYMIKAKTQYGLITTFNKFWYCSFNPVTCELAVSNPYCINQENNFRALFYFIDLCMRAPDFSVTEGFGSLAFKTMNISVKSRSDQPKQRTIRLVEPDTSGPITASGREIEIRSLNQLIYPSSFKEMLGSGGTSCVYRYTGFTLEGIKLDEIAVKSINIGSDLERFLRAANEIVVYKQLELLQGAGIPVLFSANIFLAEVLLCVTLIRGRKLSEADMKNQQIVSKLKEVIGRMHKHHVLHNDLRPENILIDQESNPWVIDFELSTIHTNLSSDELDALEDYSGLDGLRVNLSPSFPMTSRNQIRV